MNFLTALRLNGVGLNALAEVRGVSRDGEVAFCWTFTGSQVLWMASGEVVNLPAEPVMSNGGAKLSDNGQVLIGAGWTEVDQQNHLWRWSQASGLNYFSVPAIYSDKNQFYIAAEAASSDGRSVAGSILPIAESFTGEVLRWFWNETAGFQVLPVRADYNSYSPITDLVADGTSLWVKEPSGWWRWTPTDGLRQFAAEFAPASRAWLTTVNGTLWVASDRPLIETLSPSRGTAGQGDTSITIYGVGFQNGAQAFLGNTALSTTYVGPAQLQATIPAAALVATGDFATLPLTVRGPTGAVSSPVGFTVTGSGLGTLVDKVDTAVVTSGSTATVSIPPTSSTSGGISASLTASGSNAASVSVATYTTDPSGSGGSSFAVAGQFLDLNASGVTTADSMQVYFYYPAGTPTENLSLKFWNTRLTPAAWDTVTPTTIDPVAHRIKMVFNASSHPSITELGGTFFAPAVAPPIQFTGFLSPIGGADATGGSVTTPLRTFKLGSTVPVKFTAAQGGTAVNSGLQTLKVQLCSTSTTTASAIDATPQGNATTGNQFRYADGQWQFNLDTKATGMTKGVWKVTATLSDKSQHSVWIQLK